jgi:peptidoglycan/xylan/chitin deacetylase (PgdA/CDA1 family)
MGRVALTFDDLPGITQVNDQPFVDAFNAKLLAGLRQNNVPAIGFVVESKLEREGVPKDQLAILHAWLDAGFLLGNHTYSHDSPNALGAEGYEADIARGEVVTRPLMEKAGRKLTWFRAPYLETGHPQAVKDHIERWLTAHGYKVAPVTIDADDWEFADPYEEAVLAHDKAKAAHVKRLYLDHTERAVAWFQQASQAVLGRQISFVMLLHDTALNADSLPELLKILERRKLKPVPLEKAMKDKAYRLGNPYAGKDGIDWLERWSDKLGKPMPWASFHDVPKEIVDDYNRLNPEH